MKTVQRTERHVIKADNPYFDMLLEFCHLSKNLYNQANYEIRHEFFATHKVIGYNTLDKWLKANLQYPDYRNMPTAQSAKQTLRALSSTWKSFLAALKSYAKNPDKFTGRSKPPGYLSKTGCFILTLTNQNCKLKDNIICFPKVFNGFTIKTNCCERSDFKSFQQVRILPDNNRLIIEIVYKITIPDCKQLNNKIIGIDLGVNNLATIANNFHGKALIINGKPLKAINQFYNKQRAFYQSLLELQLNRKTSKRLAKLDEKRNNRVNDYLHKASRLLVNYCVNNDITQIVIGKNDGWKQGVNINKRNNQNFVNIPHAKFINMLCYKAEECGISVILTEESYTSGTSFIDNEMPEKKFYNKSRRIHRGLFKANNNILINADLNAAYQIIKKVFPLQWGRGCVLHPSRVNI